MNAPTSSRRCPPALLALAAAVAACGSPPPPPPRPAPVDPAPPPLAVVPPSAPRGGVELSKLPTNGVTLALAPASGDVAQIQLGILAGAFFMAPGLAELAAQTIVEGSDAAQGRNSLAQTIRNLGGDLTVQVGPVTTWIGARVPRPRWNEAVQAIAVALANPVQSRSQIERIRDDLILQRTAEIRTNPTVAMARGLLLGETSTSGYLTSLLDRDPSEVSLFISRLYRPNSTILALQVAGEPKAIRDTVASDGPGSLATWAPPAPPPGTPSFSDRRFASGVYWSPGDRDGGCRASLVLFMPDLGQINAAEQLILHACLTLDGTGGRIEQIMRENGLSGVRWQTEFVQTSDAVALVMSADLTSDQAATAWRSLQKARQSLRDVPPSTSEIELARRRALLTARLGQLRAADRLRVATNLEIRSVPLSRVEQRLADLARPGALDVTAEATAYLEQPVALVVFGGKVPADLTGVHSFEALPPGAKIRADSPNLSVQATAGEPFVERAIEAAGGAQLLERFLGFTYTGALTASEAPEVTERIEWRTDGALGRRRELLGSTVETALTGSAGVEQVGPQKLVLQPNEAAILQREMARHPLALLAAAARRELRFRPIAQRNVGDRDLMMLEAISDRFDRLRIHVDMLSSLIRQVDVWETLADGSLVHIEDAWSDYRSVGGVRAPFRRLTTQNDGQNRTQLELTDWQPTFRAAKASAAPPPKPPQQPPTQPPAQPPKPATKPAK